MPEDGPIETYVSFIKTLPTLDVAELFGQHANSEIPFRIEEGELFMQHLSKFQGDKLIQKGGFIETEVIYL